MDRGAWRATVLSVAESDTTGVIEHTLMHECVLWDSHIFPYFFFPASFSGCEYKWWTEASSVSGQSCLQWGWHLPPRWSLVCSRCSCCKATFWKSDWVLWHVKEQGSHSVTHAFVREGENNLCSIGPQILILYLLMQSSRISHKEWDGFALSQTLMNIFKFLQVYSTYVIIT